MQDRSDYCFKILSHPNYILECTDCFSLLCSSIRTSTFALFYCFIDSSFLIPTFFLLTHIGNEMWQFNTRNVVPVALYSISFCHQFRKAFIASPLDYCNRILTVVSVPNFYSLPPFLQLTVSDVSITQNWLSHSCLKTSVIPIYIEKCIFLSLAWKSFIIWPQHTYAHAYFFAFRVTDPSILNISLFPKQWALSWFGALRNICSLY